MQPSHKRSELELDLEHHQLKSVREANEDEPGIESPGWGELIHVGDTKRMKGVSVHDPSQNENNKHRRWGSAMNKAQALQSGRREALYQLACHL